MLSGGAALGSPWGGPPGPPPCDDSQPRSDATAANTIAAPRLSVALITGFSSPKRLGRRVKTAKSGPSPLAGGLCGVSPRRVTERERRRAEDGCESKRRVSANPLLPPREGPD